MPLSDFQKYLYNLHLKVYRKKEQKPYTERKNFDNFETEHPDKYASLIKISQMLTSMPHINKKLYFEAPYALYPDKKYFGLDFYTKQLAIKVYTLYLKQLNEQSPDSPSQLEFITDSLKFVRDFCIQEKIELSVYFNHKSCVVYSWAKHIAEYHTSPYFIIGFAYLGVSVYDLMMDMPDDERELLLGELPHNYASYKCKLDSSEKAKMLVIKGLKAIDESIQKELTKVQ